MKQLSGLLIFAFFLICCKKDKIEPIPAVKEIVGKWRLEAYEKTENGVKTWEKVTETTHFSFRFDGVILDRNELLACCAPKSYTLNGTLFLIEPKAELPKNPQCNLVDCIGCESWNLEQAGDELIVERCSARRAKYIRE